MDYIRSILKISFYDLRSPLEIKSNINDNHQSTLMIHYSIEFVHSSGEFFSPQNHPPFMIDA